ncbi:uncharacterized protein V1513DRAFT_453908 [Lipomyces chichibuensis]|uniref:uncharacterized protein n=1 Tax=Lipomyces chichibuensis TaxID=1546026 RepID=UPI0033433714
MTICIRDELLRWRFRQAVLANIRGAGEPSFETDFPPGTDMVGEILSGPAAATRMEVGLSSRLAIPCLGLSKAYSRFKGSNCSEDE